MKKLTAFLELESTLRAGERRFASYTSKFFPRPRFQLEGLTVAAFDNDAAFRQARSKLVKKALNLRREPCLNRRRLLSENKQGTHP
jgi:hypothetical protein